MAKRPVLFFAAVLFLFLSGSRADMDECPFLWYANAGDVYRDPIKDVYDGRRYLRGSNEPYKPPKDGVEVTQFLSGEAQKLREELRTYEIDASEQTLIHTVLLSEWQIQFQLATRRVVAEFTIQKQEHQFVFRAMVFPENRPAICLSLKEAEALFDAAPTPFADLF